MNLKKSEALFERAKKVAPGGVHSPVRAFRAVGGSPVFFEKGEGAYLWDADGNRYVDFCMSWGALSVGHAHPTVVEAISEQARKGTHYGTPTHWDVELAEMALEAMRPYEKIRFVNSGTEAVMTVVRLCRGITGRSKIVKVDGSYHGHLDAMLVNAGSGLVTQGESSSKGVTKGLVEDTLVIPYHSIDGLEVVFKEWGHDIAALVLEPVMANNGLFEFSKAYFEKCRELTKRHGAMLVFDEVITGFRVGWGGAKEKYGIEPDISSYGKIIGGGMPVGAIAAKSDVMENLAPNGKTYQAGTLSGNPIAMAAGLTTLKLMKSSNYYQKVEELGCYLDAQIQNLINSKPRVPLFYRRVDGMFWLCPGRTDAPSSPNDIGDRERQAFKEIYHKVLQKGVYISPSVFEVGFISPAHSRGDLDLLVQALKEA